MAAAKSDIVEGEEFWDEEEEEVEVDSEDLGGTCREPVDILLKKNTESFQCLGQYIMSRSSLLKNPLYYFPPLEDPGIDAAFYPPVVEEPPDDVGAEKYMATCKDLGIMILRRVVSSLQTTTLNLKYYSLSHKQIKAITRSLGTNAHVKVLNLEENFMDPDSVQLLSEMLVENQTLEVLNMRECRVGPEGAEYLADGISLSHKLTDLNLSCNSLGIEGLGLLKDALLDNSSIKRLNLSKNQLDNDAIPLLIEILSENSTIEDLDLSWNTINAPKGYKKLAKEGLIPNKSIRALNLAWNAIGDRPCIRFLMIYAKKTDILEKLDLSSNKLQGSVPKMLKTLLLKNTSLLSLNVSSNKISPEIARSLIELLLLPINRRPKLEALYMDNIYIKKDCLGLVRQAQRQGKIVTFGGVLCNWTIQGPNVPKLLFDRARLLAMKPKKKKLQKDFSWFIFTLPEAPMQGNDFTDAVTKFKMKQVDKGLVAGLMNEFKFKKSGVDAEALRKKYIELYPDAKPQPKKEKKKKKKKKGKTDDTITEGEEEGGWGQGDEYYWDEEMPYLWGIPRYIWDEGEDEFGEFEDDMGEENAQPVEVAHGESVTDVIAQIGDGGKKDAATDAAGGDNQEGGNKEAGEGNLAPIAEVSEG